MKNRFLYIEVLSFFLIIVLISGSCSVFYRQEKTKNDQVIEAFLDSSFVLHEGQSAFFRKENLSLKILKFYNSPCPKGANCIWSGVGVEMECIRNRDTIRGIDLNSAFGYRIHILETDHEKFVKLKMTAGD